ncbi:aspartyl/glutamyl-tRNA(Asn/Gln) amidotransferase subunit C [candidate division KSB1 bacterium 4572_119]|nr:MAG: aspartyl/glutamyl-tRNA(Asn/Gln) amidotransferase subunit C [candidate division KSB1 bacterium 4572_119]
MMLKKKDVEKIAKLARLRFSEDEKENMARELSKILEYVDKINELDLDDVKSGSDVFEQTNGLREDKIKSGLTTEEALQNAPARHGQFFSVPKVIKKTRN